MIDLATLSVLLLRAPVARPMRTSFGVLRDRPALLVRLEDRDGAVGWGEGYCNNPPGSGEHRAGLLRAVFAPLLAGQFVDPPALHAHLTAQTRSLALQCAEPGPFAHCICAIDIAAWDLVARRAGQTVRAALGGGAAEVPAYLSGLDPDRPERRAEAGWAAGHRAFKMKLGFGRALDLRNARAMRDAFGSGVPVAMDANQAWDAAETATMAGALAAFDPMWLEEPVPADTPLEDWAALARACPVPLAAGENLVGERAFAAAIGSRAFAVLQPDPVKWGGLSALAPLARRVVDAGLRFCPHYLGGGLGLVAAAQLAAAAGPDSMVEVDDNENPLREMLATPFPTVREGRMALPDGPGLGVVPDLVAAAPFLVSRWEHRFERTRETA